MSPKLGRKDYMTNQELKKQFEEKFTYGIAPSIDPKAISPYNETQRYIGKVISVADNEGKVPNGIRYIISEDLWNFFSPHLATEEHDREILEGLLRLLMVNKSGAEIGIGRLIMEEYLTQQSLSKEKE